MFQLVRSDPFMLIVYALLTLFIFFCEFLVVLIKMCSSKTNYERKLELIEGIGNKRMEIIMKNDLVHYDANKVLPEYRKAKESVRNSIERTLLN